VFNAAQHADPCTTMRYDRARNQFDYHRNRFITS
jgi:hypothetical protein